MERLPVTPQTQTFELLHQLIDIGAAIDSKLVAMVEAFQKLCGISSVTFIRPEEFDHLMRFLNRFNWSRITELLLN